MGCVMTRSYDRALAAYFEVPCRETWENVRSFVVPGTGRTVWQSVLASSDISCVRGGRFADGADVPTPDDVSIGLLHAQTRAAVTS